MVEPAKDVPLANIRVRQFSVVCPKCKHVEGGFSPSGTFAKGEPWFCMGCGQRLKLSTAARRMVREEGRG